MTASGYFEEVSSGVAKGWAMVSTEASPNVRIVSGTTIVGEGVASTYRPDLETGLGTSGRHSFRIELEGTAEGLGLEEVSAFVESDGDWIELKKIARRGSYQDFDGTGGSKSGRKLEALLLSDLVRDRPGELPLKGKKVLDIGCNEGFFCLEAVRQGASRVVGIEANRAACESARARCPDAQFLNADWWSLPEERFDIVFFLSAIHYEANPKAYLDRLLRHLTPDGVLILECGVFQEPGIHAWRQVERWDGAKRYPTQDLLLDGLLSGYSVRWIGQSVDQDGDPVARFVYHATPLRSTVVLVHGASGAGKTTVARDLRNHGYPTFQTDSFLDQLLRSDRYRGGGLARALRDRFEGKPINFAAIGDYVAEIFPDEFAETLVGDLPLEMRTVIVEGEILRNAAIRRSIERTLAGRHVNVWSMERQTAD